jgi:hypothetical protein
VSRGKQSARWENGSIPNWFQYGSFSGPGTYGIALDLRVTDEDENVLGREGIDGIVSNFRMTGIAAVRS